MTLEIAKGIALPLETAARTIAFLGQKGSGKTFGAMKLTEQMLEREIQVVCLDPTGVWWGLRSGATRKASGFEILVMGGDNGDLPLEPSAGVIVARFVVESGRSVVLDLSGFESGAAQDRFVADFAETLYRLKAPNEQRSTLHLMLDEADSFAPQRPGPSQLRMLGAFEAIVRRGRSRGLGMTMITQRPAVLHKNVLSQVDLLVALRVTGKNDFDTMRDWTGIAGDQRQSAEFLQTLAALQNGEAWFWSPAWLGMFKRAKILPRVTFDSSRTPEPGEQRTAPQRAEVDLTALSAEIAASIERAKESDPAALKRRIAELETEMAKQQARWAVAAATPAPVMTDVQFQELATFQKSLFAHFELFDDRLGKVLALRPEAKPAISAILQKSLHQPAVLTAPHPAPPLRGGAPRPPADGVQPRHQEILDALASFEGLGLSAVSKGQLAVFCGRSPLSSGWANDLGAMRSAGRIGYPSGGQVQLTSDGRAVATASLRFATLRELHAAWLAKLQPRQADIVRSLVAIYPAPISKDELADAVGKSAKSSGFANDLGALRSLGLLDYPQSGHVAATDLLFPPLPR